MYELSLLVWPAEGLLPRDLEDRGGVCLTDAVSYFPAAFRDPVEMAPLRAIVSETRLPVKCDVGRQQPSPLREPARSSNSWT